MEKLREKALLKEFKEYKQAKKKLKVFRLEAVRAGFKKAWQDRDCAIIISVAEKIPNKVLEEDPKLLIMVRPGSNKNESGSVMSKKQLFETGLVKVMRPVGSNPLFCALRGTVLKNNRLGHVLLILIDREK